MSNVQNTNLCCIINPYAYCEEHEHPECSGTWELFCENHVVRVVTPGKYTAFVCLPCADKLKVVTETN